MTSTHWNTSRRIRLTDTVVGVADSLVEAHSSVAVEARNWVVVVDNHHVAGLVPGKKTWQDGGGGGGLAEGLGYGCR